MARRLASLLVVALVALSACGSPSTGGLTDPKDILVKSVDAIQAAKTFALTGEVSGKVHVDFSGRGSGAALDLAGTTIQGAVDLEGGTAHVTLGAPALFGVGADVIVAGGVTYTRVTGPISRTNKYTKQASSAMGLPADPKQAVADLKAGLDKLTTPPTKDADESCGGTDCYRLTLKVASSDLGSISSLGSIGGAASGAPGVSGAGTVDLWVRKDNLRPVKIVVALDAGGQGSGSVTLVLSNFGAPVAILAPPPDQIEG